MRRQEEIQFLVEAYKRQLNYLVTMEDPAKTKAAAAEKAASLVAAEDHVMRFLDGGQCSESRHKEATMLHKLVMLKTLRIEFPYISTSPSELDRLIVRELKKCGS